MRNSIASNKKTPLIPLVQWKESKLEITKQPIKASVKDKVDYVSKLWGNKKYAELFVNECKKTSRFESCVMWGSSIALHESNAGRSWNAFFGVLVDRKHTYERQIIRWVQRFITNRWYERKTVDDRRRGWYCQSETPWVIGCPNRLGVVYLLTENYKQSF